MVIFVIQSLWRGRTYTPNDKGNGEERNQHELNTYCASGTQRSTVHTLSFPPHHWDLGIVIILHFTDERAV